MSLERVLDAIRKQRPQRVVVFTGAGVSAESGVPTFRGEGGLWREFRPEDLATPEAFNRDPTLVWEWYEWRRELIGHAQPNAAHRAIASVPSALVVTQNVDGLHTLAAKEQTAGSPANIIELHGNIFRLRCTREGTVIERRDELRTLPPQCSCGALLRPDVVWFGEMLPEEAVARATSAIRACDLLLVIGTSGVVYPAAGFVALHRGLSIEINPQASAISSACTYALAATATEATPPIVDALLELRS